MSHDLTVAALSGVAILAASGVSLYSVRVTHHFQEQRRHRTKDEVSAELMSRYRDPLMRAAFDLQSRLYNILRLDFLERWLVNGSPSEREYAELNTLYVMGEFFAWVEILRLEIQFLDLRDLDRNKMLTDLLDGISETFLSSDIDPIFRVFRGEQRAIGELMTTSAPRQDGYHPLSRECIGYATFVARLEEPEFARWFVKPREDIAVLKEGPEKHSDRLIALQHALLDVIDFMDPASTRFAESRRVRL